MEMEK